MASNFEVLDEMAKRNMRELMGFPAACIERMRTRKEAGAIEIAMPNDVVQRLMVKPEDMIFMVIVCDRPTYMKVKAEMEAGDL